MSERKVLNKYYPPDFDPSKIPRMKLARNRQYTVRLMAPFNMRCKTCGEYIYKGKKFNARKEDVEGDDYLGIRIYRFYIKCTRCLQEISFKTDPKNTDYEIEAGATRNFMALKLAEEQAQREEDEEKEEEATNPMKLLEKRTQQSKQELELLESLEDLKDLNRRQRSIDYDGMLAVYDNEAERRRAVDRQEKIDEEYVKSIFGNKRTVITEEEIVKLSDAESHEPKPKTLKTCDGEASPVGLLEAQTSGATDKHENAVTKRKTSRATSRLAPSLRTTFCNLIKKKATVLSSESTLNEDSPDGNTAEADSTKDRKMGGAESKGTVSSKGEAKVSGLSLLCSYSDSSDNELD